MSSRHCQDATLRLPVRSSAFGVHHMWILCMNPCSLNPSIEYTLYCLLLRVNMSLPWGVRSRSGPLAGRSEASFS